MNLFGTFLMKYETEGDRFLFNLALQNILKYSKIRVVNFKEVKLNETRYQ